MLASLSVRNVVLIEKVDFSFKNGFCVLTGETGAGKSVLLDSLALATGRRADSALLRSGADEGSATAVFEVGATHPATQFASQAGINTSGSLILRRVLPREGRGQAFVNDQPVTVGFLDDLGDLLIQIHGQHDRRGLLDPSCHGKFLDGFGSLSKQVRKVGSLYRTWQEKDREHREEAGRRIRNQMDEEKKRAMLTELDEFSPQEGEEKSLASRRTLMMKAGDVAAALNEVEAALGENADGASSPRDRIVRAATALEKLSGMEETIDELQDALGRALLELDEANGVLNRVRNDLNFDPAETEKIEERLFALRRLARRHETTVDALPKIYEGLQEEVSTFGEGDEKIEKLVQASANAREDFEKETKSLSVSRKKAGEFLDGRIADELEALRLQGAQFVTTLENLPKESWGTSGGENVRFRVSTVEGNPPGPLNRIASGGELSRFLLAVHVSLARVTEPATLVFDEIDAGVGGAVADAVGQRLARLARHHQVLAVTHQPQVAARGGHQWRVLRKGNRAEISELENDDRIEEIARMLSATNVTIEARKAAKQLLTGGEG